MKFLVTFIKNKINQVFFIFVFYLNILYLLIKPHVNLYYNKCFLFVISCINKLNYNIGLIIQKKVKDNYKEYTKQYDTIKDKNFIVKGNNLINYSDTINTFARRQRTKFYLASSSLWPLLISIFLGCSLLIFICILATKNYVFFTNQKLFLISAFSCIYGLSFWITVFYKEKLVGYHTYLIRRNIELGFYIFIFTEALCFLSLFWIFFHSFLSAGIHIGGYAPGEGIANIWLDEPFTVSEYADFYVFQGIGKQPAVTSFSQLDNNFAGSRRLVHVNFIDKGKLINPYNYPWLNTIILLSSACVLNVSHVYMKKAKYNYSLLALGFVIILGLYFLSVQFNEFKSCAIEFNDGIYACCFYSLTGLHGFHVILGVFCLTVCFINILLSNYTKLRHQTFFFSIVYWHFVDVVWILVYLVIYLWPSVIFFKEEPVFNWIREDFFSITLTTENFENIMNDYIYEKRLTIILQVVDNVKEYVNFNEEDYIKAVKNNTDFFGKEVNYEHFDACVEMYNNITHYNYNFLKKDPKHLAFFLTITHYELYNAPELTFIRHFAHINVFKVPIFLYLHLMNERLAFAYAYYYTPYLCRSYMWKKD